MKVFAHRGARGYAPENTMTAFQKGLDLGADGVELDVQLTKDGEVVICHDHTIDRTSNSSGLISSYTLDELKKLDFGSWYKPDFAEEKIPTLEEFLTWFASTGKMVNIEIKNGPIVYKGIEAKIVAMVRKHGITDRTIISSFYHPSLVAVKALHSDIMTGALFAHRPVNPVKLARELCADYLHPHWHYIDRDWVSQAHANGLGVNVYTVNTIDEYAMSRDSGVDIIISDYPDRFLNCGG